MSDIRDNDIDNTTQQDDGSEKNQYDTNERIFLVVADGSPAMTRALYYACRRAQAINGRVALFHCIDDTDIDNMFGVGDIFRHEAEEERDKLLKDLTISVQEITGKTPHIYNNIGAAADILLQLLHDEPINVIVLGIDEGGDGPGHIISSLLKFGLQKLATPLTLVPAIMSYEDISHIAIDSTAHDAPLHDEA